MRYTPLIAVPLIALSLAGCAAVQQEPPAATVAVEEQPLFASEEEALAAAQAAYTQYLAVSDQIARDGGANPERLEGLASADVYQSQLNTYRGVQSSSLSAVGSSVIDRFELQKVSLSEISNYVCLNVSGIRVINTVGEDVTPVNRPNLLPLSLTWTKSGNKLILDSSEVWTGENFCL